MAPLGPNFWRPLTIGPNLKNCLDPPLLDLTLKSTYPLDYIDRQAS